MIEQSLAIPGYLDTTAIMAGALTGAMHATRKGLDVMGVLFVAFATGVGGGLIRDVLLQNGEPVLLTNPNFQLYACVGAVVGLFFAKGASRFSPVYESLDTFMIGIWAILGCYKAEIDGLSPIPVIFIGTVASVGGAVVRDILCHEPPALLLPGYFYTVAAFAAALTYTVLQNVGVPIAICQVLGVLAAIVVRVASLRFHLVTPTALVMSDAVMRKLHLEKL